MKMIVVPEERWERQWKLTLQALELDKLKEYDVEELHRQFLYELVCLKQVIERAE